MSVVRLLARVGFALVYIFVVLIGSIAFFAPLLWPFAVLVTRGRLVSLTTFLMTLAVMLAAWTVLFLMYTVAVRAQSYFGEGDGAVVSEAFEQASRDGRHLAAAWILFRWYWLRGIRAFGSEAEA